MRVAKAHVVIMTFVVVEVGGDILDNSWASEPYGYIHGLGQMPEGFEDGVEGLEAGSTFEFDVPMDRAYGPSNNQLIQKVSPDQLPAGLVPGMVVHMEVPGMEGLVPPLVFHVKSVKEDVIKLDGNHPMAGKDLRFMGRIREVRAASADEIKSGRIERPSA